MLAYNCTLGFDECELKNIESDASTKSVKLTATLVTPAWKSYSCYAVMMCPRCGNDVPTLR